MTLDLKPLFLKQSQLDLHISNNHHINYQNTMVKRLLALLVEVGECLNETRCFKYWSNKPSSSKDVILEEYVDGLHFFLSLGLANNIKKTIYNFNKSSFKDINELFLKVYQDIVSFSLNLNEENYINAFETFLSLGVDLGFNGEDIIKAYDKKLAINHLRQKTNY